MVHYPIRNHGNKEFNTLEVETIEFMPPEKIPETTPLSKCKEILELPNISTNSKLFTDYRKYNLPWTPHYRLQQVCYTDKDGLRRYENDYIVAMGSYYSTSIGDRFKITLDNGNIFTVMFGDGKWDSDCDERNMYMPVVNYDGEKEGNLLEFIIDSDVLHEDVYNYGSLEKLECFNGNIIQIEYLGRNTDYDWDIYF